MKNLEDFVKPTQKELFNLLRKKYRGVAVVHLGSYILVPGQAPIMLIAHMDTVHEKPVRYICKSPDGNILMSPQGIGGDDRCGVYALVKVHEASSVKPWLLFTCDEEVGSIGADMFVEEYNKGKMPKDLDALKLLIEIDRKGKKDAVYYDCDNPKFKKYIRSKGFATAHGSFSDISLIAPAMGIAAVNLSSGYYNAHTPHEYINRKQIDAVIKSVIEIVADAAKPDFPKYKYIEKVYKPTMFTFESVHGLWNEDGSNVEKREKKSASHSSLPSYMIGMYNDLLELYTQNELEWCRKEFGDRVICQLYAKEFSSFSDGYDVREGKDNLLFDGRKEKQ